MKKIRETSFPLLNRTEVVYEIDHANQPTPRKEIIKKQIADELKTNEELINLNKVITNFGLSKIRVIAEVYNTKEDLQRLIKKNKKAKKEEKGEQQKEQKVEKQEKEVKADGKEKDKEQKT